MKYRNVGAPFRSSNGQVIQRGQVYEATDRDLQVRRHKLHPYGEVTRGEPESRLPVEVPEPAPPVAAGATVPPVSGEKKDDVPGWPMVISPELYLRLHPKGPKAELARKILGVTDATDE